MAPAGAASEKSLADTRHTYAGQYLLVVEGSIPLAEGGIYCTVGGRGFAEIVREAAADAAAVITVGSCAFDGGLPAASGGVTGAVGVQSFLKDQGIGTPVINLSGCPMNPENLTATIVQYLSMNSLPATDSMGRPLFAYGDSIHQHCEALPHFRRQEFVQEWGDAGHKAGWCLYQMGCKGPVTQANCPVIKFNAGQSWPVSSGHGCVGCTQPRFWDTLPLYTVGDPIAVPTPTPVAYQTPVPSTPGAGPTDAPGGAGADAGGGGIGGPEIALGGAAVVAAGAAAASCSVARSPCDAGRT
jgi:hydrogenase small subunit